MSAIKISELNSVETINNSDVLPIVNSNETKKISMEQIINTVKSNITLLHVQKVTSITEVTEENILYLVPTSEETNNKFNEYLLVDGTPELIGPMSIDLTDYVKFTDYATTSTNKAGVVKLKSYNWIDTNSNGELYCYTRTYQQYESGTESSFISKGTLENVITGKKLVDKTYVDNAIGGALDGSY